MEISFCLAFPVFFVRQETFPTDLHWCCTSSALFFNGYLMSLVTRLVLMDPVSLLHPQPDYVISFNPGFSHREKPAE